MADELKVNLSLKFQKGDLDVYWAPKEASIDIANDQYMRGRVNIGAAAQVAIDLGPVTAAQKGYAIFRNAEAKTDASVISLRCASGAGNDFADLKGQQWALLPLDPGQTYYAYASTAASLDYLVVEE